MLDRGYVSPQRKTVKKASGFTLRFWRPWEEEKTSNLKKGHWKYNNYNWFSLAGFLNYMPWDSRHIVIKEDEIRMDNRILAFKTREGKRVIILTNHVRKTLHFPY